MKLDLDWKNSESIFSKIKTMAERTGESVKEHIEYTKGSSDTQNWVEKNVMLNGKPFSYTAEGSIMLLADRDVQPTTFPRPYLNALLNDRCRDKTIYKCRQSENTANETNENYYLAITRPNTVILHLFPTQGMAASIAREKIDPLAKNSPRILQNVQKPFNIGLKHFFNNSFYRVLGSFNDTGGRGPSADKITYDEFDFQNPKVKEIYAESMSHSKLQRETKLSTPTLPNGPIHRAYNASCGFVWKWKCEHCNKWQGFSFPHNIINFFDRGVKQDSPEFMERIKKVYIGCRYCKYPVDRSGKFYNETSLWIPTKKHLVGERNGYHINYFMLPWKTGKEIVLKYHAFQFVEQFWNEIMGTAFLSEEQRLTDEMFDRCINPDLKNTISNHNLFDNVALGVDWGKTESWVVIGGSRSDAQVEKYSVAYMARIDNAYLAHCGLKESETSHQLRVEQLVNIFNAPISVNDANGLGTDKNAYLRDVLPDGTSYGAFYDTAGDHKQKIDKAQRATRNIEPTWNDNKGIVTINRTVGFKILLTMIREADMIFPAREPLVEQFFSHIMNCNVITRKDIETGQEYEVMVSTGPDHFAHALLYSYTGWKRQVKHSNNPLGAMA